MREIKFRGLDNNGVWYYGYIDKYSFNGYTEVSIKFSDESGSIIIYKVKEETVGQYTGLKDKNGNEIYEGDMLEYSMHSRERGIVVFRDSSFILTRKNDDYCITDLEEDKGFFLEIINNIYENPDLLDVKK